MFIGFFTQNAEAQNAPYSNLFTDTAILKIKLYANFRTIQRDRKEVPSYHPGLLTYNNADSNLISIPIRIKTRGHFRKEVGNCFFPPLLLNFPKHADSGGLFTKQKNLKLVTECKTDDYVIKEWLVYKIYNLVTEKSFNARLVVVDYLDSSSNLKKETHYGILLEDENEMAARNKAIIIKRKMVEPQATNHEEYLKMTMFQYMIGNTDWSIAYLHNIKLISPDSTKVPYAIPYDFDYSGIVDAPYAIPAPELELENVRQRLYRGYCLPYTDFDETVKLFDKLKPDIYKLYTDCKLLSPRYIRYVNGYLDDFYETINNRNDRLSEFGKPCSPEGRSHVLIKGMTTTD